MELELKIASNGKIAPFKETKLKVIEGDEVLIELMGCLERATICQRDDDNQEDRENTNIVEPPEIIRKLTQSDRQKIEELKKQAKECLPECQQKIVQHQLKMDLVGAELSFDEKKLTFFFTAPGRVDFRALVTDLASTFKKLIRLQQIGARDQARYLNGVGRCGRNYCCRQFMRGNLDEVTLEMARSQQLAHMGANRITGACGKLMCCLKYELSDYEENLKQLPKVGDEVKIKEGTGRVVDLNVLMKKVTVELTEGNRAEVDWSK